MHSISSQGIEGELKIDIQQISPTKSVTLKKFYFNIDDLGILKKQAPKVN